MSAAFVFIDETMYSKARSLLLWTHPSFSQGLQIFVLLYISRERGRVARLLFAFVVVVQILLLSGSTFLTDADADNWWFLRFTDTLQEDRV